DTEGEEAARFYVSVFPNSRVTGISHYGSAGPREEGSVMTVSFALDGQALVILNGGPEYRLSEAFSLKVACETQEQVDGYWAELTADGGEEGPCGWCKDRFGVSGPVVPTALERFRADPDRERAQRVMACMLQMRKLDVAELERAAA